MTLNGFARRRGVTVAAGALVVVLAACGSQAKTVTVKKAVSPQKVLLASVRATTAAKSARMSMTISSSGSGAEAFGLTADGVTDFSTNDGVLTMQFTGAGAQFLAGGIEVRVVDGVVYTKMPESIASMFGGGKWLKMPAFGDSDGLVPGFDQSDPSKFLAYLETVSSGVKKVGSEPVRGVETTHYEATLDLGKAVDRAHVPASLRDELGKILQGSGTSVTIPADVWVDNDGLARRIQMKMDVGKFAGGGDPVSLTMSMDLYDFGVPVHVEAPPASETTDLKDLGTNGGGTFGTPGATGTPS